VTILADRKSQGQVASAMKKAPPLAGAALFLALMLAPLPSQAESRLVNGTGNASARVNVRVVIQRILYLGVGDSSVWGARQNSSTITTRLWDYSTNPTAVGTGADPAVQANTFFYVAVFGNNGQISLSANNPGVLSNGTHTIPMTQIVPNFSLGIAAPAFGGAAVAVPLTAPGSRITNRIGLWSYRYLNTVVPASGGTYTAEVTYTATMP
jgi:hypothetical protein